MWILIKIAHQTQLFEISLDSSPQSIERENYSVHIIQPSWALDMENET